MKDVGVSQRIMKIREHFCNGNNTIFAEKLGVNKQQASQICNGSSSIGSKMIEKILTAFPQVSRAWLMIGDGDMLGTVPAVTDTPKKPASDDITIPSEVWTVIKQQAASLAAKDAQVDRMISLLENEKKINSLPMPSLVTEK